MYDLVIKNGVLSTENGLKRASLAIKNGKIQAHLGCDEAFEAKEVYDAKGNVIFPGLIDTHVHLGQCAMTDQGYHDDVISETRAAIQGGVTCLCTTTLSGDDPLGTYLDRVDQWVEKDKMYANLKLTLALSSHDQIEEIPAMVERGVSGFKFYLGYRGEGAKAYSMPSENITTGVMYEGFKKIAEQGNPAFAMVHCEDVDLKDYLATEEDPADGSYIKQINQVQPSICEAIDLCKSAFVAHDVGCPLYEVHVSAKETVDLLRYFKAKGYDVTAETCLHYLLFSCDDTVFEGNDDLSRMAKVNPPIREKADQEALWQGIRDGVISTLGTDAITYTSDKKFGQPWWKAACGCGIGFAYSLMLMLSEGVNKDKITLDTLRKLMSENAAKRFGMYPQKGTLNVGADADIVVIDLNKEFIIDSKQSESTCSFNLYEGWKGKGAPVATFVGGHLVVEDYKLVTEEAYGQIVRSSSAGRII